MPSPEWGALDTKLLFGRRCCASTSPLHWPSSSTEHLCLHWRPRLPQGTVIHRRSATCPGPAGPCPCRGLRPETKKGPWGRAARSLRAKLPPCPGRGGGTRGEEAGGRVAVACLGAVASAAGRGSRSPEEAEGGARAAPSGRASPPRCWPSARRGGEANAAAAASAVSARRFPSAPIRARPGCGGERSRGGRGR